MLFDLYYFPQSTKIIDPKHSYLEIQCLSLRFNCRNEELPEQDQKVFPSGQRPRAKLKESNYVNQLHSKSVPIYSAGAHFANDSNRSRQDIDGKYPNNPFCDQNLGHLVGGVELGKHLEEILEQPIINQKVLLTYFG